MVKKVAFFFSIILMCQFCGEALPKQHKRIEPYLINKLSHGAPLAWDFDTVADSLSFIFQEINYLGSKNSQLLESAKQYKGQSKQLDIEVAEYYRSRLNSSRALEILNFHKDKIVKPLSSLDFYTLQAYYDLLVDFEADKSIIEELDMLIHRAEKLKIDKRILATLYLVKARYHRNENDNIHALLSLYVIEEMNTEEKVPDKIMNAVYVMKCICSREISHLSKSGCTKMNSPSIIQYMDHNRRLTTQINNQVFKYYDQHLSAQEVYNYLDSISSTLDTTHVYPHYYNDLHKGNFAFALGNTTTAIDIFSNMWNTLKSIDGCSPEKRYLLNFLAQAHFAVGNIDAAKKYNDLQLKIDECGRDKVAYDEKKFLATRNKVLICKKNCDNPQACTECLAFIGELINVSNSIFSTNDYLHFADFFSEITDNTLLILQKMNSSHDSQSYKQNLLDAFVRAKSIDLKYRQLYRENIVNNELDQESSVSNYKNENAYKQKLRRTNNLTVFVEEDDFYKELLRTYVDRSDALNKNVKPSHALSNYKQVTIDSVQEKLRAKNAQILDYYVSRDYIWLLHVTPEYIDLHQIPIGDHAQNIETLVTDITEQKDSITNRLAYQYTELKLHVMDSVYSNVIIVPSQFLFELPFEILIDETERYLVQNYNITYLPNINTLTNRNTEISQYDGIDILSFTTDKIKKNIQKVLPELSFGYMECASINHIMPRSNFKSGTDFNNENLRKSMSSSIVHLMSHIHADVNDVYNNFIYTKDNNGVPTKTYGYELENTRISAKLVVLSGCESGRGKYALGSTCAALSTDIMVGGAQSIIKSLWAINDQMSAELMTLFYKNLEDHTVSKSLTLAKRQYLSNQTGEATHPYYWSGFIYEGPSHLQFLGIDKAH